MSISSYGTTNGYFLNVHLFLFHTYLSSSYLMSSFTSVLCLASSPPRLVRSLPPPAMTSPGLGGAGHYGQQEGPQSGLDGWIEQQQRQFRDFDSSFGISSPGFADFDTFSRLPSIFAPSPRQALAPPPHGHPSSSSLVPCGSGGSVNRSTTMALQSGEADMSPKAKVSYDQDKFQVEFNVQDYTPEVSPHPLDVRKTVLYKPNIALVLFVAS